MSGVVCFDCLKSKCICSAVVEPSILVRAAQAEAFEEAATFIQRQSEEVLLEDLVQSLIRRADFQRRLGRAPTEADEKDWWK